MVKAIFPATFDPVHLGHCDIAVRAAKMFDEVFVGVYDRPIKRLMFPVEQRLEMVKVALDHVDGIHVQKYSGLTVDFAREVGAKAIVRGLRVFSDFELEFRMALANHRLAPDIEVVCLITSEEHMHLSSSTVQEIASLGGNVSSMVPAHVNEILVAHFREMGDDEHGSVDMISLRD